MYIRAAFCSEEAMQFSGTVGDGPSHTQPRCPEDVCQYATTLWNLVYSSPTLQGPSSIRALPMERALAVVAVLAVLLSCSDAKIGEQSYVTWSVGRM